MSAEFTKPAVDVRTIAEQSKPETVRRGWQDKLVSLAGVQAGGATYPPSFDSTGLTNSNARPFYAWQFDQDDYLSFVLHITHEFIPGTLMYPHMHWMCSNSTTGTITWELDYSVARGYAVDQFANLAGTVTLSEALNGTAYTHYITESSDAEAIVCPEIDSILLCTITRTDAVADTNAVFGLQVDFHYQSDMVLTPERNAPFTKSSKI